MPALSRAALTASAPSCGADSARESLGTNRSAYERPRERLRLPYLRDQSTLAKRAQKEGIGTSPMPQIRMTCPCKKGYLVRMFQRNWSTDALHGNTNVKPVRKNETFARTVRVPACTKLESVPVALALWLESDVVDT